MLKPQYIKNILSVTKEKRGEIDGNVVCECGSAHFIGYKNLIVRSEEEAAYEIAYKAFNKKYRRIRFGDEKGIPFLYGMKGLFGKSILEKFEYKQLDATDIIKVKCAVCGKEYILFDSRFHGYNAIIPERENTYDGMTYDFTPIVWKNDKDGVAMFAIKIQNDDSLEEFIENAYETDEETYSNSFGWISIKAVNIKTKEKKILLDLETQ